MRAVQAEAADTGTDVKLVERMLGLHKKLPKPKGATKTAIERRIKSTDRQIDELVYELYGLTEKEIRIVEDADH